MVNSGESVFIAEVRQQLLHVAKDTWATFLTAPSYAGYLRAEIVEGALAATGYLTLEEIRAQRPEIDKNVLEGIFFSF